MTIMTIDKPDGKIEFGFSSCYCCPPGESREGMHLQSTSAWYRIDDGEWVAIDKIEAEDYRILAKAADTVKEFIHATT